jgi:hypothetical protein
MDNQQEKEKGGREVKVQGGRRRERETGIGPTGAWADGETRLCLKLILTQSESI